MNAVRGVFSFGVAALLMSLVGAWLSAESLAQAPASPVSSTAAASADKAMPLTGAWTLNKDKSDQPQNDTPARDSGDANATPRGGGRRGGGFGGGRGGGFGRGGNVDPQEAARMREAMRDIVNPPDHLTIVSTGTMILLTGADGRTVRLSPDGKKIKDDSTNIERKTKWDGANLVSEVTGLAGGKATETYTVDADHHQLHIAAVIDGVRGGQPRTISHVYDQDPR